MVTYYKPRFSRVERVVWILMVTFFLTLLMTTILGRVPKSITERGIRKQAVAVKGVILIPQKRAGKFLIPSLFLYRQHTY
jgi:hypothetical protein